jgi:hypothetical protein
MEVGRMKRSLVALALAWVGLSGCASPEKIRQAANLEHERAKQLAANGDRYGAAKAEAKAVKQYDKATKRAAQHMAVATTYHF